MSQTRFSKQLSAGVVSLAVAAAIVFGIAKADGDMGSDVMTLWDGTNSDWYDLNGLLGTMATTDPYGGLVPDTSQIDPVLSAFVTATYQNWVNYGSTVYNDGYRVYVDWSFGDAVYRYEYIIINGSGTIHTQLISTGEVT
jgi:hypothetical protein